MRIGLAGCRKVETWPVASSADDPRPWERDDRGLHAALRARGAAVETPAWDDPAVDWGAYDAVVPRATWDYHERRDAFLGWIDRVPRLINPPEILRWNTHKSYLRGLDVPQPPTVWLTRGEEPDLGAIPWPVAFAKPAVGATAAGTLVFRTDPDGLATARAHLAQWLPRVDVLVQPYVASVETAGERSAIAIDGEITHWVRKIPVPGDYRVQDDHGATDVPHEPEPAERALAAAALGALGQRLAYARVDWLVGPTGPMLVELELVEPCLFFRHGPSAAERLADAILARV
ncbi:MAG: hypothetical protein ABMB14_14505 [Myxococcota bacterium]